ncbi:MAG: DOMON-like domain-containing protein [Xanthobacteraceae bacterium]
MRQTLRIHPTSLCTAVAQIEVEIMRPRANRLVLAYVVTGRIGDLVVPPVTAAARTDELWRHTCFEAFVSRSWGEAYYEFNFAPSTQWAAYQFSGHRSGMRVASEIGEPWIEVQSNAEQYTLRTSLELDDLLLSMSGGEHGEDAAWRLGLSAVIEEADGRLSYWALAHPQGRPDFHHSDCFALEVPQPWRP